MNNMRRLFMVVIKASFMAIAAYALLLMMALLFLGWNPKNGPPALGVAVAALLSIGAAAWWLFRSLQLLYTARQARSVALAFALFTPASLAIAFPLSLIPAGYLAGLADIL